jgi:LuxR family maltose regulon positive regulatory protein
MPLPKRDATRIPLRSFDRDDPVAQLPRLPRHIIERPRLLEQLDARAPLTVIRGPLGFGKTTLVVDWLRRRADSDELAAWMTVDSDSEDSDDFWDEVVDALTEAGVSQHSERRARSARGRAARMIRAADRPILLVIDRFEAVAADGIDREVIDLVRSTSQLRVIVCLRTHRYFAASGLVDIDATTIDAQDLRLTAAETRSLLSELELDLSDDEIETLLKHGGGWPEPTRAAALALAEAGRNRDVVELTDAIGAQYFRERLLPEVRRPDLIRFAILSAIPDSFTAQTAAILTGERSPDALLNRLEEQGFLVATPSTTSPSETVFRWPEAGRQALLAELHRQMPMARIDGLRSTLARWYLSHDHPQAALVQAMDARDWPLVTSVIDGSWRVLMTEHGETLRAALIATPREIIASSVRAVATRDIMLRAPDDLLLHVTRRSPEGPMENRSTAELNELVDASTVVLIALRRRGRFADAREYAERVRSAVQPARAGHPIVALTGLSGLSMQIGIGEMLAGNPADPIGQLMVAWESAFDDPHAFTERDSAGKLALVHAVNGDIHQAKHWLRQHRAAQHAEGRMRSITATAGIIAEALVTLEQADSIAATRAADILTDVEVVDEFWAYLEYTVAQCAIEEGNWGDTLARLDRARQRHRRWLTPRAVALPMLASAEADVLMAAGHGNQALSVLEAVGLDHEFVRVSRARLALLTGETDAVGIGEPDSVWQRSASTRARIEMLLINAIAAERAEQPLQAERMLQQAMTSAARTGRRRPFLMVPRAELASIATRLPAISADLYDAIRPGRELYPAQLRMVALSEREHRVLEQAVAGLTIQQIARTLFVSVNTVKSQLKSLYRKLEVGTRADAISRAISWGLVDQTTPDKSSYP